MKKPKPILILILLFCFSAVGCDKLNELYFPKKKKRAQVAQRPAIKIIDDMELAQAIMKPERKKMEIVRDPFKPLITKETAQPIGDNTKKEEDELKKLIDKIKFQGVVKIGEDISALIKTETKKGVFKVTDPIDVFTLNEIQPDYVILKKGDYSFQLKRGEK